MKKHPLTLTSLLAAGLLAGCASPLAQPQSGAASLVLTPRIAPHRSVQALIEPWKQADVKRVVLELYNSDQTPVMYGDTPARLVLDNAQAFYGEVRFTHLKPDTLYRVQAYGYEDLAGTHQITVDASSSLDVNVGYYELNTAVSRVIPLQLTDREFNGQATASFDVIGSNLVASGSETLDFYSEGN
jgi:hypothetical protein